MSPNNEVAKWLWNHEIEKRAIFWCMGAEMPIRKALARQLRLAEKRGADKANKRRVAT